jgi:carboxymethylenebutenolidase
MARNRGLFEETEVAFERLTGGHILEDLRSTVGFLQSQFCMRFDCIRISDFGVGDRIDYLTVASLDSLASAVDFYGGRCFVALGDGSAFFELTADIGVPWLGLFGNDDPNPSPDDVEKMRGELERHSIRFEFHSYAGAGHAFNYDERSTYRREVAIDACGRAIDWMDLYLRS